MPLAGSRSARATASRRSDRTASACSPRTRCASAARSGVRPPPWQHESVAEVVVRGVPDEKWGEVGRAVIVVRAGHALDAAGLQAWLAARLAKFKVPKTVVFVEGLPRTETGKIARAQVRARWGETA